jgi:hypothetical protein
MPYQTKEKPQTFRRTWKREPERTFEASMFPGKKVTPKKKVGKSAGKRKSEKRV